MKRMDAEKTMQFLLDQQAVSAARMGQVEERLVEVTEQMGRLSE